MVKDALELLAGNGYAVGAGGGASLLSRPAADKIRMVVVCSRARSSKQSKGTRCYC